MSGVAPCSCSPLPAVSREELMNVDPACPLFETRDRRDEFAGAQVRDAVAAKHATYVAYALGGAVVDAKGDSAAVANKSLLVEAPFVGSSNIVQG